jgi:hypothetical protein
MENPNLSGASILVTILPWPTAGKPRRARKLIVDPLPRPVLHSFVSGLPGPKDESEAERAVRFEAQLAEVLSYKPRNSAEAMMATHCIMLRLLAEDTHRDAARPSLSPAAEKKNLRIAKQFDKLVGDWQKVLQRRQAEPPGEMDAALCQSLGLGEFLIPDPADTFQDERAVSAIIVPLHPAPKMLQ